MKNILGDWDFIKKCWPTWLADSEDGSIEITSNAQKYLIGSRWVMQILSINIYLHRVSSQSLQSFHLTVGLEFECRFVVF